MLVNISLALLPVYIQAQAMGADREVEQLTKVVQRRLRGAVHEQVATDMDAVNLNDLKSCLYPAILQICVSLMQIAFVIVLAQGPRLSTCVNRVIKSLEGRVNENLNDSVKDAVDAVFDKAFTQVKELADGFFPKFKGLLDKLQEVQEAAEKAKQMGDSAQRALGAVKGFW